jgi:hypothetical protein
MKVEPRHHRLVRLINERGGTLGAYEQLDGDFFFYSPFGASLLVKGELSDGTEVSFTVKKAEIKVVS